MGCCCARRLPASQHAVCCLYALTQCKYPKPCSCVAYSPCSCPIQIHQSSPMEAEIGPDRSRKLERSRDASRTWQVSTAAHAVQPASCSSCSGSPQLRQQGFVYIPPSPVYRQIHTQISTSHDDVNLHSWCMQVSAAACAVEEAPPMSLDPEEGYAARIYPGFLVRTANLFLFIFNWYAQPSQPAAAGSLLLGCLCWLDGVQLCEAS